MTPAQALEHFSLSCGVGVALGVYYGFLRPLRPRHPVLSDLLFLPALVYAWLVVGFAVCRGDLRLGCYSGLLLGAVAWELTLGRLLRRVFAWFWRILTTFWRYLWWPMGWLRKKLRIFLKFLLLTGKKAEF